MGRHKKNAPVEWHTLKFMTSLAKTLRPREPLTLREWAEKNMIIPEGAAYPGKFSTDNMPHQKEILEAVTDPEVRTVTIKSSAQVGKTIMILCGIGYYIDYEPSTQIVVMPTLELAERFSKTRLAKMIQDVKPLTDRVSSPKAKDSSNTIRLKEYPGGYIVLSGANSAQSLSSMPARIVWMDEVDRFPESAGTEGDPVELAEVRATSYWNRKYILTSTPTDVGGKIDLSYSSGTMDEWCVQCPCCGTWQPYEWGRITFKPVGMTCAECGEVIEERWWKESEHKWIAAHPERVTHRSFHLNAMANPTIQWSDIIEKWKKANDELKRFHSTDKLKTFINTVLGECWEDTSEAEKDLKTWEELQKKAEPYEAELPDGVILLTAAVDVQADRFELEIKGWGRKYENWGIYKTEIYGNMDKEEVWDELEEYLERDFYFESGSALGIAATAIDTGYKTNTVYKWVKAMNKKGKTVYGIKGYANKPGIPLIHKRSRQQIKDEVKGREVVVDTMILYVLGVDAGKEDVIGWLEIDAPGEKCCHFPDDEKRGYNEDYYKGLTSERKVEKRVNGKLKTVWVKKRGVRNEPLDLFNYNYAAYLIRNPNIESMERKVAAGINYMRKDKKRRRVTRKPQKGIEW